MRSPKDAELRMAAEIVFEMAKGRGRGFDLEATALMFCRAALADPSYRVRLANVHRRLEAQRASDLPPRLKTPIAPLFPDLERDAEAVRNGWKL